VSRVFAAEANTEHAVFLQEVRRWSVYSELLREVAYAFEPESLDTESSIECCGISRHIVVQTEQNTFAGANKGCIFL
jgi:hypothetical protein